MAAVTGTREIDVQKVVILTGFCYLFLYTLDILYIPQFQIHALTFYSKRHLLTLTAVYIDIHLTKY